MRTRPRLALALAACALVACLAGCGSDQPQVCDDLDSLQSSVDNLKNVQVAENGLNALSSDLTQVKEDVATLSSDAKSQYGAEIGQVTSAVKNLEGSVTGAKDDPSVQSLADVATALKAVGTSVNGLADAVSGSC